MKKCLLIALSILTILTLASCSKKQLSNSANETTVRETAQETVKETAKAATEKKAEVKEETKEIKNNSQRGNNIVNVEMNVKDYGVIQLELYKDVAPITVENFTNLVKSKFYDGLTFHRIISGFMIQGGDPLGSGMGGSDKQIKGEFASNGVNNQLSHKRGVISMARSNDPDSASSQFFIMHEDGEFLDGNYAAFGQVTSGIEVVDKICEDSKPVDGNGKILKEDQPVIEYIKIID